MLGQRRRGWKNIKTTLAQRLVFAGSQSVCYVWPNIEPTLIQRLVSAGEEVAECPENTMHLTNVGSMLGHRLRLWPNIEPALGQCINSRHHTKATCHHLKTRDFDPIMV